MENEKDQSKPKPGKEPVKPQCSCVTDPFTSLPPELRPRKNTMGGLRKVACPACSLTYWTNRKTDLCADCEKKGVRLPEENTQAGE